MSCKIVSSSVEQKPERLKWKTFGGQSIAQTHTAFAPDVGPGAGSEPREVNKLNSRVVELERTMEAAVKQARERGFSEGHKAGRDSATAELQPVMERLLRSCSEVAGMRAKIRQETEADIVTLTVAIARRVLRRELSVDPEAIHGVVKAALEKVQAKEICVIRAHPDHVPAAKAFLERAGLPGLELLGDPTLTLGGVIVETKRGNLDASVETQLKEIERGFTDRLGK